MIYAPFWRIAFKKFAGKILLGGDRSIYPLLSATDSSVHKSFAAPAHLR
jgi:hypothetical protein